MRTKPATRWNHPNQHAQYGIYNWVTNRNINDKEVIKECLYAFCEAHFFEMKFFKDETKMLNWVQNRFGLFAPFTVKYLTENNYPFVNPQHKRMYQ